MTSRPPFGNADYLLGWSVPRAFSFQQYFFPLAWNAQEVVSYRAAMARSLPRIPV